MAIKQVTCPKCRASMNIASSMSNVKCNTCGNVFSEGAAASASASAANPYAASNSPSGNASSRGKRGTGLIVGGVLVGAVGVMLLLAMFATVKTAAPMTAPQAMPSSSSPGPSKSGKASGGSDEMSDAVQGEASSSGYRVVDLPESTRRKIYRDYKQMIASSFGKAKKIPKSGAAGQSLQKMLGGTVDREITHMALIHKITEEDIAQIVAEGEAKDW